MALKTGDIADPPNVVPTAVVVHILGLHLISGNLLAQIDRLDHGAVAVSSTTHVVDFTASGAFVEVMEGTDQVGTVNIVPDLFAFVAKHRIGRLGDRAFHQISQKAVQLRS